jgi:hypothetical protein
LWSVIDTNPTKSNLFIRPQGLSECCIQLYSSVDRFPFLPPPSHTAYLHTARHPRGLFIYFINIRASQVAGLLFSFSGCCLLSLLLWFLVPPHTHMQLYYLPHNIRLFTYYLHPFYLLNLVLLWSLVIIRCRALHK